MSESVTSIVCMLEFPDLGLGLETCCPDMWK